MKNRVFHLEIKIIAKNQNTFAKRQREMEKKFKAQEKLNRRAERKLNPDVEEPEQPAEELDDADDLAEESL